MKWLLVSWLALSATMWSRADDLERVLEHVPNEAGLVLITPSLDKLVEGLTEFGKSTELEGLGGLTPAKLLSELDMLEKIDGLDTAGPFLMALSPGQASPVFICRLRDGDAWRAAVAAQTIEGGMWRVNLFGEPAFAATEGSLLVVADEAEAVRGGLHGGKEFAARFGERARAWLADNQVMLAVRVSEWTNSISPALNAARASLQISMMIAGQQDENMLRLIGWLFERADGLLGQIETYTVAMRVGRDGVFVHDALSFARESPAAEYLKRVVKTDRNLLRGLVDSGEDVFIFAYEWELEPGVESLSAKGLEALFASGSLRDRLGEEKFQPAYKALLASNNQVSGSCTAISAGATEPLLCLSGVQFASAPQQVLDNTRLAYETTPEFMGAFGGGASVEVACRREKVDSADAFACQVSFSTGDEQARHAIETLYGHTLVTYYAEHPQGVAYAMGAAERATAQLKRILSEQGQSLVNNARVQQACGRLTPHPQALFLVDTARVVKLALRIARPGSAAPATLTGAAENVPLIAYGGYLDGATLCNELHVPAESVKLVVTTVRALKEDLTSTPAQKR